jgi:small ligand-binding sensory domain FIST
VCYGFSTPRQAELAEDEAELDSGGLKSLKHALDAAVVGEGSVSSGGGADKDRAESTDEQQMLMRPITGVDPVSGRISVGDLVEPLQTLQFHTHGPESSKLDIVTQLKEFATSAKEAAAVPVGAVMFACVARTPQW